MGKHFDDMLDKLTQSFVGKHGVKYIELLFRRSTEEWLQEIIKAGPRAMMKVLVIRYGRSYMEEIMGRDNPEFCKDCGKPIPWDCNICARCADERGP